jgi:hypothetical protein
MSRPTASVAVQAAGAKTGSGQLSALVRKTPQLAKKCGKMAEF